MLKVFMQIFFVVTFLSLFFFLYVVKVEKTIFQEQINLVVDRLYDKLQADVNVILPANMQTQLKQEVLAYLNTVTFPPHTYDSIQRQNDEVIERTQNVVIVFATLVGTCWLAVYLLRFCVDFRRHLGENAVVLGAVALTEYLFLNLVTRQYIAANPNHIQLYFAQRVQAYAQAQKQKTT